MRRRVRGHRSGNVESFKSDHHVRPSARAGGFFCAKAYERELTSFLPRPSAARPNTSSCALRLLSAQPQTSFLRDASLPLRRDDVPEGKRARETSVRFATISARSCFRRFSAPESASCRMRSADSLCAGRAASESSITKDLGSKVESSVAASVQILLTPTQLNELWASPSQRQAGDSKRPGVEPDLRFLCSLSSPPSETNTAHEETNSAGNQRYCRNPPIDIE